MVVQHRVVYEQQKIMTSFNSQPTEAHTAKPELQVTSTTNSTYHTSIQEG